MNTSKILGLASILFAFLVGLGSAYGLGVLYFVSRSGLLYVASSRQDNFGQMFDQLAHLGMIEYAAANCSGVGDVQTVLKNEGQMLKLLAEGQNHGDAESLPLAAARARLAARELIDAGTQLQSNDHSAMEESARAVATSAGWKDPSETHLREIIGALDRDTCRASFGGSISQ